MKVGINQERCYRLVQLVESRSGNTVIEGFETFIVWNPEIIVGTELLKQELNVRE